MNNLDLALGVFLVISILIGMIKYEGEKEERRGTTDVS